MAREVNIFSYLPPVLHQIKEYIEIAKIENLVLEDLWQKIEDALNDQFIVTATEKGLERYEKTLKLRASDSDSIETRRFRLLTRYQEQIPFTFAYLNQSLTVLLRDKHYEIERDVSKKTLTVKVELAERSQFESVVMMLERTTPQNLVLTVGLLYRSDIIVNRQLTLGRSDQFAFAGDFFCGPSLESNTSGYVYDKRITIQAENLDGQHSFSFPPDYSGTINNSTLGNVQKTNVNVDKKAHFAIADFLFSGEFNSGGEKDD